MPVTDEHGRTFDEWLALVDQELFRRCALTHEDLPDGPSHDRWAAGVSPTTYAHELLRAVLP